MESSFNPGQYVGSPLWQGGNFSSSVATLPSSIETSAKSMVEGTREQQIVAASVNMAMVQTRAIGSLNQQIVENDRKFREYKKTSEQAVVALKEENVLYKQENVKLRREKQEAYQVYLADMQSKEELIAALQEELQRTKALLAQVEVRVAKTG